MLKKVILGIVFAVFIGVLITGAVIRTIDKTEQTAEASRSGGGNGRNAELESVALSEGQAKDRGRGASEAERNETKSSGRGRGGNGDRESELLAEAESEHVGEVYVGIVVDVTEDALTLETSSGESILIEGRAWSFAREQGFGIQEGARVQFEGFFEDGEFKVSVLENLITGESIVLRDASGRPGWAGGGRGNL